MAEPVEDADNVMLDCTERQLQNDLLSLHNAHLDCWHADYVIPRYPYTKPHAQQLVLPEEFNNSWWKLDTAFAALLVFPFMVLSSTRIADSI